MSHQLASGLVWHERQEPRRYAFRYNMTYLWCDIDALDRGEGAGHWMSAGPGRPFQMRREDHLAGHDNSWRGGIESWLERAGLPTAPRIHLLTLPRLLGRTFNPVSFWIGRGTDGTVAWMVAEVNNTFGERHLYPLDTRGGGPFRLVWTRPKSFPVSPFHDTRGEYEFRLDLTDSGIRIRIDLSGHGEGVFRTGMRLGFRSAARAPLARIALDLASSVALTVPRILWHAARLHFGGSAVVRPRTASLHPWTIHRGRAVLLQRVLANPTWGRLWKRLGRRPAPSPEPIASGVSHGT